MVRMTAEERREEILRAAVDEFARRGFQGASTTAIAHGAGVSQPYLFQLFPGKHALFLAALERGFAQAQDAMTEAAAELTGPAAIEAMRARYLELVTESGLVQLQFQVYCAALDDPEIRDAAARALARMWRAVAAASGEKPEDIMRFFANGMVLNMFAAVGAPLPPEREELPPALQAWAERLAVE